MEADEPQILSGVYEGYTTGAPLAIVFHNTNTRSQDYEALLNVPRPGHADYTANLKYGGFQDPRGGGHFSGRLTLPVVAAGVIAKKLVQFRCDARLVEIGGIADQTQWEAALDQAQKEGDSLGGVVECVVSGVPAGLGEPFWDSVESRLRAAAGMVTAVATSTAPTTKAAATSTVKARAAATATKSMTTKAAAATAVKATTKEVAAATTATVW